MSVYVDDLLQPTGQLADALFPDGDMEDLVAGWLEQGSARVAAAVGVTDADAAVTAWVYYRAYAQIADRLSNTPASVNIDGSLSQSISADQRKYFSAQAEFWLGKYSGLVPVTSQDVPAIPVFFGRARARTCWPV